MDKDYLSDFSLKCGSWTSSFLYICRAIVTYIILPLAFISLIEGLGPRLGEMTGSEIDFGPILTEFAVYLDRYMFYSIPLLLLAGFIGYYPAGNYARIPFKFLAAVYLSIMLLMFTNGGHLNVTLDGDSLASLGIVKMDFTLSIVGIIYILSIIAFVKGFLAGMKPASLGFTCAALLIFAGMSLFTAQLPLGAWLRGEFTGVGVRFRAIPLILLAGVLLRKTKIPFPLVLIICAVYLVFMK